MMLSKSTLDVKKCKANQKQQLSMYKIYYSYIQQKRLISGQGQLNNTDSFNVYRIDSYVDSYDICELKFLLNKVNHQAIALLLYTEF